MKALRMPVFSALFAALIVVGAYLRIPIGPVPIVLSNFFVILAGAVLGAKWGGASIALYLLLGIVGLPVFAGGGGLAYLRGPTGGFLLGYLPAGVLAGIIVTWKKRTNLSCILGLIAGAILIYVAGVPWLKVALEKTWPEAFTIGMLPFLPGDAAKVVAAFLVVRLLEKSYPEVLANPRKAETDPPSLS